MSSAIQSYPELAANPWGDIAPLWRRVVARATDLLVVFFIEFVLVVVQVFWFMDDVSDSVQPEPWGRSFMATVIFIGIYAIYEVIFHTRANGQTPGKLLLQVKVVRAADGEAPRWWQSAVRWPLVGVAFPLLFAPNLGFPNFLWLVGIALAPGITAIFSKNRRGIHDLLAATIVVSHEPTEEEKRQDQQIRDRARERREKYSVWRLWTDRSSGQ